MRIAAITPFLLAAIVSSVYGEGGNAMKIKYLGHAAFEVTTPAGKKLVFDPYEAGAFGTLRYGKITGDFDIAVVSHDHADHTSKEVLSKCKEKITKVGNTSLNGIKIESFATFHDDTQGSKRGKNLVTVVEADGFRIAHLGDLGHMIEAEKFPSLHNLDVMMIPVGGYFTIDAATAAEIVKAFAPKIVIPMHYKTKKVDFPITSVEEFTKLMGKSVKFEGKSEIEITKKSLPTGTAVVVLEPAN